MSKFVNNINLAHRDKPVSFDGDVQFFLATDGRNGDSPDPAAWWSHVTGQIDVHPVPCRHSAMTQPEPLLAQIDPVPRRTAA
jgi:nonribosomal peptide synthetase DhbF